MMTDEPEGIWK